MIIWKIVGVLVAIRTCSHRLIRKVSKNNNDSRHCLYAWVSHGIGWCINDSFMRICDWGNDLHLRFSKASVQPCWQRIVLPIFYPFIELDARALNQSCITNMLVYSTASGFYFHFWILPNSWDTTLWTAWYTEFITASFATTVKASWIPQLSGTKYTSLTEFYLEEKLSISVST